MEQDLWIRFYIKYSNFINIFSFDLFFIFTDLTWDNMENSNEQKTF